MMVARPRETPPKNLCPVAASSPGRRGWGGGAPGSDESPGQEGVGRRGLRSRRRLDRRWLGQGGRAVQADEQKQQTEAAEDGAHGTPLVDAAPLNPFHTGMA